MSKLLTFDCGCKVELDPNIPITYFADTQQDCPATWKMICDGDTKGIFQVESKLGKKWCKNIKPDDIQSLSDLIALVRPGCVSKDTRITLSIYNSTTKKKAFRKMRMEDLYKLFHRNRSDKMIVSVDENTNLCIDNTIEDIIFTGQKEVFKPIFKVSRQDCQKFYDLECTDDHKLLVHRRGWTELKDINLGDRVAVVSNINKQESNKINFGGEKHFRYRCYQNYEYRCIFCDWLEASLDVNHLEGNRKTNNNVDNLCFMCPNHHRLYSEGKITKDEAIVAREQYKLPNTEHIHWAEYIGKESLGIKDVYDISVKAPNHNFIAGNVVVHNCLKAMIGDKSMTDHYADRRNHKEEIEYIHESIKDILAPTLQIIVYQEQILQISKSVGNFDLKEADELRRGIGKKKAEIIAKMRELFVQKATDFGALTHDEAVNLFDLIEASNRYSFNASHSVSYATQTYQSAFIKAHFPLFFYESWLEHAEDKQKKSRFEEMAELIEDAKLHSIITYPPDLRRSKSTFALDLDNNCIYFGLRNIKGIGEAEFAKTSVAIKKGESYIKKPIADWTWYDFLAGVSDDIKSTVTENLIQSGALDYMGVSRKKMLYDYSQWQKLSPGEKSCITLEKNSFDGLLSAVKYILDNECWKTKNRIPKVQAVYKSLLHPPMDLVDSANDIIRAEVSLLGVPLSRASVDDYECSLANCTCKEIYDGNHPKHILLGVEIKAIKEHKTKKGDKMAFLTVTDGTAIINNITVFPEEYSRFRSILTEQSMVYISAAPSDNGYKSIVAKKITEMNLTNPVLVE